MLLSHLLNIAKKMRILIVHVTNTNRCLMRRIENEVKIFSGPTTVIGSRIRHTTGTRFWEGESRVALSQETCRFVGKIESR